MSQRLSVERWDEAYRSGRYEGEPPIEFVDKILHELGDAGKSQLGLYVGCGNGRNYIPMLQSGLRLHGMDTSPVAIEQLTAKYPEAVGKVFAADFLNIASARVFDYLVSIQVFQHGNKQQVDKYFKNSQYALKPGGKLFLRVNSAGTEIYYPHKLVEGSNSEGKTVLYENGPKTGMEIHFYSHKELLDIAEKNSFDIIIPPYEIQEQRSPDQGGTWTQWETIWKRKV